MHMQFKQKLIEYFKWVHDARGQSGVEADRARSSTLSRSDLAALPNFAAQFGISSFG